MMEVYSKQQTLGVALLCGSMLLGTSVGSFSEAQARENKQTDAASQAGVIGRLDGWANLGPRGGNVGTIAVSPSSPRTVITTDGSVLFHTASEGKMWSILRKGLDQIPSSDEDYGVQVSTFAFDPQNSSVIYLSSSQDGVLKSQDGGQSWVTVRNGLKGEEGFIKFRKLLIDPRSSSTIYGMGEEEIFRTLDGGLSWQKLNIPNNERDSLDDLVLAPSDSNRLYAAIWSKGIARSDDGGSTWTLLDNLSESAYNLAVLPGNADHLIAASYDGLVKSLDGGLSWQPSGLANQPIYSVVVDPSSPNVLYAGGDDSVYRSQDGGQTWRQTSNLDVYDLTIAGTQPTRIYLRNFKGVFVSIDGTKWQEVGPANNWIYDLDFQPGGFKMLMAATYNGLFRLELLRQNWVPLPVAFLPTAVKFDPHNPKKVHLGGSPADYDAPAYQNSANEGRNWKTADIRFPAEIVLPRDLQVDPRNPSLVYAAVEIGSNSPNFGDRGGISLSENGGTTWRPATFPDTAVYTLQMDPKNPDILYAGTGFVYDSNPQGRVFKSVDRGKNWESIFLTPNHTAIKSIVLDPIRTTTVYAGGEEGLFKSVDGGATWTSIADPRLSQGVAALAIHPKRPQILYAATPSGVLRSQDAGQTWKSCGLAETVISSLAISPNRPNQVYAGTSLGIFRRTFK